MKITIGKSDKLSVPGMYESSGTSLSVEFEIDDSLTSEQRLQRLAELKNEFEALYWPLVSYDFQVYLQRLQIGTKQFLDFKTQAQK